MNQPFNLSCAHKGCDNVTISNSRCTIPNLAPRFPVAVDHLQAVITVALIAASLAMNVTAARFIWKYRKTERRTFLLSLLLVYFNLQYTFTILPIVFISCMAREWIFGEGLCVLVGGLRDFFFAGHFMMLIMLAVDHFLTIFVPSFYERHKGKMAVGMFLSPFLVGMIRFITCASFDCIAYVSTQKVCSVAGAWGVSCAIFHHLLLLSVTSCGIMIPTILCSIVYTKLRRLDKKAVLSEENRKQLINGKIFGTFIWLIVALKGIFLIGFALSFVYYILSPLTIGSYVIWSIIGHTFTSCITFTNTAIIFHVLYVREALHNSHQSDQTVPWLIMLWT